MGSNTENSWSHHRNHRIDHAVDRSAINTKLPTYDITIVGQPKADILGHRELKIRSFIKKQNIVLKVSSLCLGLDLIWAMKNTLCGLRTVCKVIWYTYKKQHTNHVVCYITMGYNQFWKIILSFVNYIFMGSYRVAWISHHLLQKFFKLFQSLLTTFLKNAM